MTRKIVKTFIYQGPAETPEVLYPRSDGRWGSFQNTYAVWPTNGNEVTTYTIIRKFTAPYTGTYYFRSSVDNSATVYVDDVPIGGTVNFNQNPSRVAVTLAAGERQLKFVVSNAGDVAGFALTISNSSDSVIWDTRTYANSSSSKTSRYNVTMPFKAHITAKLWGGGGGGGGMDAGSYGGSGAPGLYNTYSFDVEIGDTIEVSIGTGGNGGSSNSGSAPGGVGGAARINVNGNPQFSFNGGSGTAAGPSPYSGGGGGGGGATVVLKNGIPVTVAGGGAGGGGGGNDGNGSAQTTRRTATIANNANDFSNGGLFIDILTSSSYSLSVAASVAEYTAFVKKTAMTPPPINTKVGVFGWGAIPNGTQNRSLTTNNKVILASNFTLNYFVNKGTEDTWGQIPDSGESLLLQYSTNGSSWTTIDTTTPSSVSANTWVFKSIAVPSGAINPAGVFLRFYQETTGNAYTARDTWGFTSVGGSLITSDYRGETGQAKGGDGGGAGGGGGGYPGGQGGYVAGGDASGYCGQCGGNFPVRTPLPGEITSYNGVTYSLGGQAGGGNGVAGIAILEIEPISLLAVKTSGAWQQIGTAHVKVSGTWRPIDAIYTKVNGSWRQVNGVGDKSGVDFAGSGTNYGSVNRPFS